MQRRQNFVKWQRMEAGGVELDMLLYRGDHLRNARGFPQKIEGGAEAIQQAMIRLSVPKGSFTLDEELGSRLHTLGNMAEEQQQELALEYAREALMDMSDIRVVSASCKQEEYGVLSFVFSLEYTGVQPPELFEFSWRFNY